MVDSPLYPRRGASLRLAAPLAVVIMVLATVLIALRIEQILLDFAQAHSVRAADQLADGIEEGFRLGLSLADEAKLPRWLQRQREQDPALAGARVLGESGDTVAEIGDHAAFDGMDPVWTAQLLAHGTHPPLHSIARSSGTTSYAGEPALDASGQPAAVVWLAYDRSDLRRSGWAVLRELAPWAAALASLLVLALAAIATAWMRSAHRRLGIAQNALATDSEEARARRPADVLELVDGQGGPRQGVGRELLLVAAAILVTFACLAALAWKAREIARPLVVAQIDESARAVLKLAQAHIARAVALGVPSDRLVGVEEMFRAQLAAAPEIAFIALQRGDGSLAALGTSEGGGERAAEAARSWLGSERSGDFRTVADPLPGAAAAAGRLVVGTPLDYVDARLRAMLFDLVFAVVVSLVLAREFLGALWERSQLRSYIGFDTAWRDMRRRALRLGSGAERIDWSTQARGALRRFASEIATKAAGAPLEGLGRELVRIRFVVFLMALSDELLRPFFTVFAAEARPPAFALSPTMQAGLPVAAFMLTLTLAQPLGPWITRRVPTGKALLAVFAAGALLSLATAFARDSAALMLLRAGSGACYGLLMIIAQTHIVRITDAGQRARGLVEVPGAIVAAGVCGPALGGLIVERLGTTAGFIAAACCLAVAAIACLGIAAPPASARANLASLGGWRGIAAVMRHPRLIAVTWLVAVPARLVAAALLVVVTPLYLDELGETSSVSGRVQLLYFLAFMVTAPWVARWSDIYRRRRPWLVWGSVVSALSCAALPLVGGVAGTAICCALLGVAQAMLSAPQLALVTETFDRDSRGMMVVGATPEQALAAFRFIERFGSILAPFAVAFAVARFGLAGAVGAIGFVLLACAAGIAAALWNFENVKRPGHA